MGLERATVGSSMDLDRESWVFGHRFRERERALTFNQPVERKRAWKILAGLDFLLEVNMSFSSNNVFGYQESLRKIMKVIVNNFFLIFKTEKKKFNSN